MSFIWSILLEDRWNARLSIANHSLCACNVAALLIRRVICRVWGMSFDWLDFPFATIFASSSALSLPSTPLCPGTHLRVTLDSLCSWYIPVQQATLIQTLDPPYRSIPLIQTHFRDTSRAPLLCDPSLLRFQTSDTTLTLLYLPFHISFTSIASHYLICYSLLSHQWCLFIPSYSSLRFLDICPTPSDFPYMFIIPSRLGKSFVPLSYRLQTI